MNKKKNFIALSFATILLIVSIFAFFNKNFFSAIIGLTISSGFFIYGFSEGYSLNIKFKLPQKKYLKYLFIAIIIFSVFVVIKYERDLRYAEKKEERINKSKEEIAKRANKYLTDGFIEILSSKIGFEEVGYFEKQAYLLIRIKNKGDEDVSGIWINIEFFDNNGYFINQQTLSTPGVIKSQAEEKYRMPLFREWDPYPTIKKNKSIKVSIISCSLGYSYEELYLDDFTPVRSQTK